MMTQTQKVAIKKIIQEEIKKLQDEIVAIEKQLKPIKKDCSLDNIAHQTLKRDQDINIKRYEEANKRVTKLLQSYTDIDRENYGICMECDEDINIERLKLIPESKYCVDCMTRYNL